MSNPAIDPETGNPMSVRDITHYQASIVRANVPAGTHYWQIVDAHHLSGQENKGNHNVFIDILNANGTRRNGAHVNLYFGGDPTTLLSDPPRAVLTIDKPPNEAGTNAPMFRNSFYAVEAADMPSDKATGFSSVHDDEEAGNTNGHHSFMVVFQETVAAGGAAAGAVHGTVTNGAGLTVTLAGANVNLSAHVGADGSFQFDNVPPGTYQLALTGTSVTSPVVVSAGQTAAISLTVPAAAGGGGDLQQQLNQAIADRDKYKNILTQIKQLLQGAGL